MRAGADRLDDARVRHRRGVAVALQLEFLIVETARGVGREHQQKIGRLCRSGDTAGADQRRDGNDE
jgi:hypothetical protein